MGWGAAGYRAKMGARNVNCESSFNAACQRPRRRRSPPAAAVASARIAGWGITVQSSTVTVISRRRFWEHLIRDEADYARHVEYCWINPLKHGLVARVRDWPRSSFHRDVRAGLVPLDWGGEIDTGGDFGERRS